MTTTADRIRSIRGRKGYTQATLATATGLSERTIQTVEAGGNVSTETLLALGAVLGEDFCSSHVVVDEASFERALSRLEFPRERITWRMWLFLGIWCATTLPTVAILIFRPPGWENTRMMVSSGSIMTYVMIGFPIFAALAEGWLQWKRDLEKVKPSAWFVMAGMQAGRSVVLTSQQREVLSYICGERKVWEANFSVGKSEA